MVQGPHKQRTLALPWVALVAVYFFWGSTYVGIRAAVETVPPLLMAGSRYALAGLLMLALVGYQHTRGENRLTWPQVRSSIIAGGLLLVGGNGLLCIGEKKLASGLAALIVATVPAWMVVIHAIATKARVTRPVILALVLGTAGVAVLMGLPGTAIDVPSAIVVLVGSMFWAGGSVAARLLPLPKHALVTTALQMFAGGVLLLVVAGARGEFQQFHLEAVSTRSTIAMVWLVIFGSMVAFSAYMYAIKTLPNDTVATYAYVNPIVAVVLGGIIDHEPLTQNVLLGGAIIVASVILIVRGRAKENAAKAKEKAEHPVSGTPAETARRA